MNNNLYKNRYLYEFIRESAFGPLTKDDKRIEWIDLAKGICICLVLLMHLSWKPSGTTLLVQIRMPLFFFLSGLFFKSYGGWNFVIKKINKILLPFVFFYLLSQIIYWFFESLQKFEFRTFPDFGALLYSRKWFNDAIWFLLCLFEVNIICMVVKTVFRSKWLYFIVSIIIGIVGATLSELDVKLPLYLDSAMTSVPFFCVGNLLKNSFILRSEEYLYGQVVMAILTLMILSIVLYNGNENYIIFIGNRIYGNYIFAVVCSVLAVISVLILCKSIKWLPFISLIGRYSIVILCVHQIYIYFIAGFFHRFLPSLYTVPILFVCVLTISWLTIPFAIKYIPGFTAQKDLIKAPSQKKEP